MSKPNQGPKPQAQGQSAPPPPAAQPQSQQPPPPAKPVKDKQVDPFWLRTAFPDPLAVFNVATPPVSELFKNALFVLDANALLAPYQVSKETADDISRIYRQKASENRLFVPEQAAREFAKNRGTKLVGMFDQINRIASEAPTADQVNCPMLDELPEYKELTELITSIKDQTKEYRKLVNSLKQKLVDWDWSDQISLLYKDLITASRMISHDITDGDFLKKLEWRYTHKVPPGYEDHSKPDLGVGDLAIWFSIVKLGSSRKRDVVFVCNETKQDWVHKSGDQTLVPRIELSLEFNKETGQQFGMVTWPRFLNLAGADDNTVRDAERTQAQTPEIRAEARAAIYRLSAILDQIYGIVLSGPIDLGDGYNRIPESHIYVLVGDLKNCVQHHHGNLAQVLDLDLIDNLYNTANAIGAINRVIDTLSVRKKDSASSEMQLLKHECAAFARHYSEFRFAAAPAFIKPI